MINMRNVRIIPRLDVKMEWLIKGVQMEGWRKVGNPSEYAKEYADNGADELLFMDVVASLYERNSLHAIVEKVASEVFIPLTVGGGIRKIEDVDAMLSVGADKVAINTAATSNPKLIEEIAKKFGSQATVISIEAVKHGSGWLAMTDNGRNHTGKDVLEWAREVADRGAGEIIITSIDRDGMGSGYELNLLKAVVENVPIPVVSSGGFGRIEHLSELLEETNVSAISLAQALHWKKIEINDLRNVLDEMNCYVRKLV